MQRLKRILRRLFPKPVARAAHLKALFENEIELRLLPYMCDPNCTSIDVGAFTGTYTIGASRHSKNVIAVEPQPKQAAALRRSMPGNVRVVEAALSNLTGDGRLEMETLDGGSMSHVNLAPAATPGWVAHPVRLMRMDDLVRERVGFVKIDAEGHELEVLDGGSHIIQTDRPAFIVEAENRHCENAVARVMQFFRPFDYEGYFVYRRKLRPIAQFDASKHQDTGLLVDGPRRAYEDYINNFIFVPRERSAGLPREAPSAWASVFRTLLGPRRKETGGGSPSP